MWDAKIPERNIHAALFCNTWLEYAKYIIKGEKDICKEEPRLHYFETSVWHGKWQWRAMADWVEDKFYKGKKIE